MVVGPSQRLAHRFVDAAVVVGMNLEAPLLSEPGDGERGPFDTRFQNFALQYCVTEDILRTRYDTASVFATPQKQGKESSKSAGDVPVAVLDTIPAFAFPDGAFVSEASPTVDDCSTHTFVMSESGFYIACITFRRPFASQGFWLAWECLQPRDKGAAPRVEVDTVFMPISICLVSRFPYFSAMKDCLTAALPQFLEGGTDICLKLDAMVANLLLVPLPCAGSVAVRFQCEDQFIDCRPPLLRDLPVCDFSFKLLLSFFSPKEILFLVNCLLFEQRLLFVSKDLSLLTPITEALLALMYPFRWPHVYIPVLPSAMRSFVEAPWPFVAGLHSKFLDEISEELALSPSPPIIVNLDTKTIATPADFSPLDMPEEAQALFTEKFEALSLSYDASACSSALFRAEYSREQRQQHDLRFQLGLRFAMLDIMALLFGRVRRHVLPVEPPVLNFEQFLDDRPEGMHDYYRSISATGTFGIFLRERNLGERDQFDIYSGGQGIPAASTPAFEYFQLPPFELLEPVPGPDSTPPSTFTIGRRSRSPSMARARLGSPPSPASSRRLIPGSPSRVRNRSLSPAPARSGKLRSASFTSIYRTPPRKRTSETPKGSPGSSSSTLGRALSRLIDTTRRDLGFFSRTTDSLSSYVRVHTREESQALIGFLYLRGLFLVAQDEVVAGFQDFDMIRKASALAFPTKLIVPIMAGLSSTQQQALGRAKFYKSGSFWPELTALAMAGDDEPLALGRRDSSIALPQIGTVDKILEAVAEGESIDPGTFVTISKLLGISGDAASAMNLFHGLASLDPVNDDLSAISVDIFSMFVETWRGVSNEHAHHLHAQLKLEPGEGVLKVLPLVRTAGTLMVGTAVLTHHRLCLVRGDKVVEITRLKDLISIEKFQFKILIPPGVPALKLIRSTRDTDARAATTAAQRAAAAAGHGDGVRECSLLFFSERNAWYTYLMEMAMGHKVALATKDPSAIQRAAENIELAEAVSKVSAQLGSPAKRSVTKSRKDDVLSPQVLRMLPFSHPQKPVKKVPLSSATSYVRRIDSSPNDIHKTTVEAMVYMPASETVWCGLGSGDIQAIELETSLVECRLKVHTKRITSLIQVNTDIWTSSFDGTIHVVDLQSRRSVTSMDAGKDIISGLRLAPSGNVWSSCMDGSLTEWDARSHEKLRTIDLSTTLGSRCAIRSIVFVQASIWVATGNAIVVLDLESGRVQRRRSFIKPYLCDLDEDSAAVPAQLFTGEAVGGAPEEPGGAPEEPLLIMHTNAAHCMATGAPKEVWTAAHANGLLHVWSTDTYQPVQCGGEWRLECAGLNVLLHFKDMMWGGANSGSVYVWDVHSHSLLRELECHDDGVRSLCSVLDHSVISGSGSRDGTLVVWKA